MPHPRGHPRAQGFQIWEKHVDGDPTLKWSGSCHGPETHGFSFSLSSSYGRLCRVEHDTYVDIINIVGIHIVGIGIALDTVLQRLNQEGKSETGDRTVMQLALKIARFCDFSPEIMSTQFRRIIAEARDENLVDEPLMTKVSKKSAQTGSDSSNSMHNLRNRSRL